MLDFPAQFILFDTEYTCWEGSLERDWNGPGEFREIVEIGAVRIVADDLHEEDAFNIFVRPVKNPVLSDHFIDLTNITQDDVNKKGTDLAAAIAAFSAWCGGLPLYSYGPDGDHIAANCALLNIPFPFTAERFHNIRDVFRAHGVAVENYTSGTITRAFGKEPARRPHDALNDVRTLADGLRELALRKT